MMQSRQAYLETLGLQEEPFAPTADPTYFFAADPVKAILFRLWRGVEDGHGALVVIGGYGAGKTMLLRRFLAGLHLDMAKYRVASIAAPMPSWTTLDFARAVGAQFDARPVTDLESAYRMLRDEVIATRERTCVLALDDAQLINKRGQLEFLRMLEGIETAQRKLLNLILFAHESWEDILEAAPGFRRRAALIARIPPLSQAETAALIRFRLRQAVASPGSGPDFEDGAVQLIHEGSGGNPRGIVDCCRNTLVLAAQLNTRRITSELVAHTLEETQLTAPENRDATSEPSFDPAASLLLERMEPEMGGDDEQGPARARQKSALEQRAAQLLLRDRSTTARQ